MRLRNVLFDLDGTLINPFEGITRCLQYALCKLDLPCPPADELAAYIGPPLRQTFATLCASTEPVHIEQAVTLFRERYATAGVYENSIYPGVREVLAALNEGPYTLYVATSKPQQFAEKILVDLHLRTYFAAVHGSDFAGHFDEKGLLIARIIKQHGISPDETVMIGDRKHDIVAAKKNRIDSIGVTYGYGSRLELVDAGATHLCDSPDEIPGFLAKSLYESTTS